MSLRKIEEMMEGVGMKVLIERTRLADWRISTQIQKRNRVWLADVAWHLNEIAILVPLSNFKSV